MLLRATRLSAIANAVRNLFRGASLNMNFAGADKLDPRITFSRASNATVTGPDGVLGYAPHNLLTFSEQFDAAVWSKSNATVGANAIAAPDGTLTADYVVRVSTASGTTIQRAGLAIGVQTCTASIYAKAATAGNSLGLRLQGTYPSRADVVVDLLTGAVLFSAAVNYTLIATSSLHVGGGWYRISITATSDSTGIDRVVAAPTSAATGGWEASSSTLSDAYIWGAQLNVGALQPYYPTTVKNLLGYTQEFDAAAWTKSNAFVQTNQIRNNTMQGAVVGTPGTLPTNWSTFTALTGLTRQLVGTGIEDGIRYLDVRISGTPSASGSFSFYTETSTAVAALTGQTWTTSAYFKLQAGSLTGITSTRLYFQENSSGGGYLVEQNISVTAPTGASLASQRATASRTLVNASTAFLMPGFNLLLTGAAIDITLRIGLPQLVQGSTPGDVVATYGTARAVMYPAPDGSLTADKLVENDLSGIHRITPAAATVVAGTIVTTSVYAKASERAGVGVFPYSSAAGARFNLATGAVISQDPGVTASIVSVGSGWYRCSSSIVAPASSAAPWILPLGPSNATNYPGDGTSGIFVWGAQLSDSASLDPYVYNPEAAPTAQAYYGPRFDYDASTLAPKGLLIEEQRTNLLTYSSEFDNAAWGKAGVTTSANSATAPDGATTADKVVEDTSTGGHNTVQSLSVADNTALTVSAYVKAAGRSWVAVSVADKAGGNNRVWYNVSTGTQGTTNGTVTAFSAVNSGGGWYRISVSASVGTGAGTPGLRISLGSADNTAAYTGDGASGVYLWGAQLEAGAFATSYIPTTTAAATRAADVATMVGANFTNWYRADEGTLFADASFLSAVGAQGFLAQIAGDSGNYIAMYRDSSTQRLTGRVRSGAVDQAFMYATASGVVGSTAYKQALAYKVDDFATTANGAAASIDTSGAVPASMATLGIGRATYTDSLQLNGHIRRISYFPRKMSSSELQAITA